jgi:hypothetical protein
MLSRDIVNPSKALFASIEESISVCQSFNDGAIEVIIRRISPDELELRVFSFRGCYRCSNQELKNYLQQLHHDTSTELSVYGDRFREGLMSILPNGYGSLKLDFSKSKKGKISPLFGLMVTELLSSD